MEVVIEIRADVARLMHGQADSANSIDQLLKMKLELQGELARLGVSLRPMHSGTRDVELARYFTLSGTSNREVENILGVLRSLDAVTAAYEKPEAEPA